MSIMNVKPLYLKENLKNELDDAENKSDVIKAKKILALKLLDQSHLKDGEQPKTVKEVSELLSLSEKTIYKLLKKIEDDGSLEDLLARKKYDGRCRVIKYDAKFEAKVIQIARSEPPKGAHHWSIRLIAEELVKLGMYGNVSKSAVQRVLSRNNLKLHKS